MNHLTPEKRLDKNGRLVTKHVVASPAPQKGPSGVPAPSLGTGNRAAARKGAEKPFKPRASQTKQQHYSFKPSQIRPNRELVDSPYRYYGEQSFYYSCSEVEAYDVLSVCSTNNAVFLLSRGVRTAEQAREYLTVKGLSDLIVDNSLMASEALKRGISSDVLFEEHNDFNWSLRRDDRESPHYMDTVELFTMLTLKDQRGEVFQDVLDGSIKLSDIKFLGATRLKSFNRLRSSRMALKGLKHSDAKYTVEDIKMVLERAIEEGATAGYYESALGYLEAEGPEHFPLVSRLSTISNVVRKFGFLEDRYQRATYYLKFMSQQTSFVKDNDMRELYLSGIDPIEAGRMSAEGMSVASIIGVANNEVAKPVSEGWL